RRSFLDRQAQLDEDLAGERYHGDVSAESERLDLEPDLVPAEFLVEVDDRDGTNGVEEREARLPGLLEPGPCLGEFLLFVLLNRNLDGRRPDVERRHRNRLEIGPPTRHRLGESRADLLGGVSALDRHVDVVDITAGAGAEE